MDIASKPPKKGDKGVVMEGRLADWYAKTTGAALAGFEADARRIAARLRPGARVLEIAPGPGYLAIALAKLGDFPIVGLDISRSFVRIANSWITQADSGLVETNGGQIYSALNNSLLDNTTNGSFTGTFGMS